MNFLIRNKKGTAGDILSIGELILVVSMACFVVAMIWTTFYDALSTPNTITNETIANNQTLQTLGKFDNVFTVMDNMFLLFIVGLTVLLVITSFWVRTHKAFLIFNLMGMFFLLFIAWINSFIFTNFASSDGLVQMASYWPKLTAIMLNYPWVCLFLCFISFMVMYGKGDSSAGVE